MRQLLITPSITGRDQKSLQRYLNDIAKHDVLTPNQELELFKKYKSGNEQAFQEILNHNLRFVVSVAKKYQHSGMWLGDLIGEGNLGLIKAARRFDETRGFKFISYAVWWIRQSILQALSERARKIRVPSNQLARGYKIRDARMRLMQTEERAPSVEELAEMTGYTVKDIFRSDQINQRCKSLDAPLSDESDTTMVELMEDHQSKSPDFNVAVKESQKKEVKQLLTQLSPREADIVSMSYGIDRDFPLTLNDISDMIGISRERIRQIRDKSVKKLRRRVRASMTL